MFDTQHNIGTNWNTILSVLQKSLKFDLKFNIKKAAPSSTFLHLTTQTSRTYDLNTAWSFTAKNSTAWKQSRNCYIDDTGRERLLHQDTAHTNPSSVA